MLKKSKRWAVAFLVLMFLFALAGCAKPIEKPTLEPEPQPKPEEPESTEWTVEELAKIEEFKNQPKNDWGPDDFNLYNVDGEVVATGLDGFEGGVLPTGEVYPRSISYRGFRIGDDAYSTLSELEFPEGTVIIMAPEQSPAGIAWPYSLELAKEKIEQKEWRVKICIYFDKDFNVLDVTEVWPVIVSEGAFSITIEDEIIVNYGGIVHHHDYLEENSGAK